MLDGQLLPLSRRRERKIALGAKTFFFTFALSLRVLRFCKIFFRLSLHISAYWYYNSILPLTDRQISWKDQCL